MPESQEQFDWMQDSAKCVEGLKFDLDKDYIFDLVFEEISKHQIKRGSGDDAEVILYKKGDKKGQPVLMYTIPFKERESGVVFKTDFFANDSYRVNPENPELEDEIVNFSRKLGYSPVLNGDFSLADFLKPGIAITARLKERELTDDQKRKGKKAYNEIDISSVVLEGESPSAGDDHQEAIEEVSHEDQEKVQKYLKESKAKKLGELTTFLSKKKEFKLVEAAIRMKEQGLIKIA